MSEEEKRALQGAILLELEEAKAAFALLRKRAELWAKQHEEIAFFLRGMAAEGDDSRRINYSRRSDIEKNLTLFSTVANLDAIFKLDVELQGAEERLRKAEASKREIGFA